jgi:hypothetical protein
MPTISIRVSDGQKIELEGRSASYGGNVSEYIKDVLFRKQHQALEGILHRLDDLSAQVSRVAARPADTGTAASSAPSAAMQEMLILLRMSLQPNAMRAARAELERLKIEPWEPTSTAKGDRRG